MRHPSENHETYGNIQRTAQAVEEFKLQTGEINKKINREDGSCRGLLSFHRHCEIADISFRTDPGLGAVAAHYYRSDLQVHTPRDLNWAGKECVSAEDRRAYAESRMAEAR